MWVFVLFLAVPLIEIGLFVTVGGWLTLWPTLAIVVGTGILGVAILRLQGLRAMTEMQTAMKSMQSPISPMGHNAMIMAAGIFFILPGFFTDTIGFLLLIRPLRQWVISHLVGRMQVFYATRRAEDWRSGPSERFNDEAIDAEYSEVEPERPSLRRDSKWTQD